ncbi:MAG TPA: hypothetical protein PLL30_17005 [Candidatus Krumholzibacteria bacterium]|nr:hypothetical protein [Candidatus Krumholzibacteria bacterium]HRY42197.1 hypothetical protein [Candidatus Krumholzibacteria bacterium]
MTKPKKPAKLRAKAEKRSAGLTTVKIEPAAPKPKIFTPVPPDKLDDVLASITAGTWTRAALEEHGVPAGQFYRTLDADPVAAERYTRAKAAQMAAVAEEMREIQDEPPPRVASDNSGPKVDPGWVAWQKNRIETRKWLLAKLAPKKYGDRVETTLVGADGGPIQTESTVALPGLDELKAQLAKVTGARKEG